jgi:hypothetical protein
MMATLGRGTRRRYDSEKKRFRCIDCGVDTCETDDYYMVYDHVWHAAGMVGALDDGMLCLDCLSRRLGRGLYLDDFTMAPVNRGDSAVRAILRTCASGTGRRGW